MATKKTKQDASFEDNNESLTIDMDAVEAQSFELIPKGEYECVIEAAEYKLSASSSQPMWNVTLAIVDGEYAGRKLFTFLSFSPKALPGTKAQIQRFAPELLSKVFDPKRIADDGELTGKAVRAKTKIEPYEGENKTRVAGLYAPKTGGNDFA